MTCQCEQHAHDDDRRIWWREIEARIKLADRIDRVVA